MTFVISIPISGVKPRNGPVHWDKNQTHVTGQVNIIFREQFDLFFAVSLVFKCKNGEGKLFYSGKRVITDSSLDWN